MVAAGPDHRRCGGCRATKWSTARRHHAPAWILLATVAAFTALFLLSRRDRIDPDDDPHGCSLRWRCHTRCCGGSAAGSSPKGEILRRPPALAADDHADKLCRGLIRLRHPVSSAHCSISPTPPTIRCAWPCAASSMRPAARPAGRCSDVDPRSRPGLHRLPDVAEAHRRGHCGFRTNAVKAR